MTNPALCFILYSKQPTPAVPARCDAQGDTAHVPASVASRFCRFPLATALCLVFFSLFALTPQTAYAQALPPGWAAIPCDAKGVPLTYVPQVAGFNEMKGTESWTITNTYPPDLMTAALAAPSNYSSFLNSIYPLIYLTPQFPYTTNDVRYGGIGSSNSSGNPLSDSVSNSYSDPALVWYYAINPYGPGSHSGTINGSVTVDMTGQLVYYFKIAWQGRGAQSPLPSSLSLLLWTNVFASASVSSGAAPPKTDLWAQAWATDGSPFSEMATAGVGVKADGTAVTAPGPARVTGYHLVRAGIDPATAIAQVYVNGQTKWQSADTVPYGVLSYPYSSYPGYPVGTATNGPTSASSMGGIQAGVRTDSRTLVPHRDGAHGETQDADGTVHGDTTYSYLANAPAGLGSSIVQNMQVFHPYFYGSWSLNPAYTSGGSAPVFNIKWQWDPSNQSLALGPVDTWNTHSQKIDVGTVYAEGAAYAPQQWYGAPDAVKVVGITYTATDLGLTPNATGAGSYILSVHDQYDNWRVVDAQGKPTNKGTPGPVQQLAAGTTPVPAGAVAVSLPNTGVNWTLTGINGGGAVSAVGSVVSVAGKTPTWVGLALSLAGLAMQTAGSQPTDPSIVNSPDQMNQTFLQSAYSNYNPNPLPGQTVGNNLVDTKLYNFISSQIKTPQDWNNLYMGLFTQVSVTATVSVRTLNYNYYANQYDTGGLVTTTYPGSVTGVPGGLLWSYVWTYAGIPAKPASPSIMPSA